MYADIEQVTNQLIEVGRHLYSLGMVPATSGNFSARINNGTFIITASGRHKGKLEKSDILGVDAYGQSLDERKPSAETLLHVMLYQRFPNICAVIHHHSMNATVLSKLHVHAGHVVLQGYELLKAFAGFNSHSYKLTVPIFENDQNIARLADRVDTNFEKNSVCHGILLSGHGLYTWGNTIDDALHQVEAFEFLFECELKMGGMNQ